MWRLCASFLSLGLLLGCGDSPSEPGQGIPFTTLAAARVPGSAGPQIQTVVRHQISWGQVWSDLWGDREPARPAVDFSREMVVVVTGSQACFGNAEVEEIVLAGGELRIRYADAGPSLCLCIQPELSFHAVRAPRAFGEVRFEVRQTPSLCPTDP